ncbi:hypothetical protein [Niveibacterium sp. COAC-50]|uniref:hypothetical protein n=1 Tax=Niveibacterium sp. COAC-50 TaxID=2729384 RepID=UPI00155258EE|nr:hypothetical protein [Niveibacterium sp. COAC-50]
MRQHPNLEAFNAIVAALARGTEHSRFEQPRDLQSRLLNAVRSKDASPEQVETRGLHSPENLLGHITDRQGYIAGLDLGATFITQRIATSGFQIELVNTPDETPLELDGAPAWLLTRPPHTFAHACLLAPRVKERELNLDSVEYALDAAIEQLIEQRRRIEHVEIRHGEHLYCLSAPPSLPRFMPQVALIQTALLPVLGGDTLDGTRFEAIERHLAHWASSEALDPYQAAVWGVGPRELAHWCEPVPALMRVTARVAYICLMTRVRM